MHTECRCQRTSFRDAPLRHGYRISATLNESSAVTKRFFEFERATMFTSVPSEYGGQIPITGHPRVHVQVCQLHPDISVISRYCCHRLVDLERLCCRSARCLGDATSAFMIEFDATTPGLAGWFVLSRGDPGTSLELRNVSLFGDCQ